MGRAPSVSFLQSAELKGADRHDHPYHLRKNDQGEDEVWVNLGDVLDWLNTLPPRRSTPPLPARRWKSGRPHTQPLRSTGSMLLATLVPTLLIASIVYCAWSYWLVQASMPVLTVAE
jgi:hypothetical protein